MKKNLKKCAVALAAILTVGSGVLVSCEKGIDELNDNATTLLSQSVKGYQKKLDLSDSEREAVAREVAKLLGQNSNSFVELNNAIQIVTNYGLDENVKLYDILQPQQSVFLNSASVVTLLYAIMQGCTTLEKYGFTVENYYGNLQFYWPYHDEWDKTTTPIICFAPSEAKAESVEGYYYQEGKLVSKNIMAKDIDEGKLQVIIINQSEVQYSQYPNFKGGEWTKDGVIWAKPSPILPIKPSTDTTASTEKIYEARSVSFTSSGAQYDYIWAGGSEFELLSVYAADTNQIIISSKARVEFSRKEIKSLATKNFGTQLHENWQPGFGKIHLILSEDDDWGSIDPIVVNLDVAGNTLSTAVNFDTTDDLIFDGELTRSNYFNRCYNHNGAFDLGGERVNCLLEVYDSYGD